MRSLAMFTVVSACGLLLAAGSLAAGCGSNDVAPGPAEAGTDGAGGDAGVDARPVVDAGPDREQDPDVYPSKHQPIAQVDNLGGPILDHVQLVTVTFQWGPDGGADPLVDTFNTFDDFIIKSDWWHQALGGYGVLDGVSGGHVALPDTVSNSTIDDTQIQQFVIDKVNQGKLPAPTKETLYAFYFPKTTSITLGNAVSCQTFAGYHNSATVPVDGGTIETAYAVMPRCDFGGGSVANLQGLTNTASHEFAEATTDPTVQVKQAYYLVSNDAWILEGDGRGGEVGDLCAYYGSFPYDESGFKVQSIWSNKSAAMSHDPCQPSIPNHLYYGAAVRTTALRNSQGQTSDGYIVVPRGTSVDFDVDVFSEAPLPHDVSFYIGVPLATFSDPSQLGVLKNDAKASLSITSGHNGNAAVLTVSVPAMAALGDSFFVVRSVLAQDDFHDWPVILHVK